MKNPSGNSSPGGGFGSCGAHATGPAHVNCYCHWCIDGTMIPVSRVGV